MATSSISAALRTTSTDNAIVKVVEGTRFLEWTWKATDKGGGIVMQFSHNMLDYDYLQSGFVIESNIFEDDCISPFVLSPELLHKIITTEEYAAKLGFETRNANSFYCIKWDKDGNATSINRVRGALATLVAEWKKTNDASINPPAPIDPDPEDSASD